MRISAAGTSFHGRAEPECIPEILCASPGSSVLPGLFDRNGFVPD